MARLGEIIDGKYEILREIGKGGMSVVYLAMDKRLNKQWAIKEFRKDKDDASKQVALKALLDEANLMKKLDHPTLPRIVDIIETNQTVYIVMDYIEGESLNKVLDAYGAQPQEAVIEWAKQLSNVLDYLHTQSPPVIYRDMKPANIMLKPDGTVRLIDFGIAREYKEGKEGDTEAIGTRGYAAPEQFGGRGQTDARTDIYSLGVTLYHLVTGKNPAEPPYEIYPIRHWNPSLSSGLEWLIQKCTQLNPSDRYQSCAEVTYVLENLDKFEGAYQKKQRGKVKLFVTFATLAFIFGITSVGFWQWAKVERDKTVENCWNLGTLDGYRQAIDTDDKNAETFKRLAHFLRDNYDSIYEENPSYEDGKARELYNNEILVEDINNLFNTDDMKDLLENAPEAYAEVHYNLGIFYWSCYKGESEQNGARWANQEFQKVMTVASGDKAIQNAGLSEKEFKLAQAFYSVSFFQANVNILNGQYDGKLKVSDEAKTAGIKGDEGGYITEPYYTMWMTNKDLISLIADDTDMEDISKLASLQKIAYDLSENHDAFRKKGKVEGQDMVGMYGLFSKALSSIVGKEEYKDSIEEICNSLNSLRPSIETEYEIELEEVK